MLEKDSYKNIFIMYRGQRCPFMPNEDNKDPNNIKGLVIFIEKGSYNPNSWYTNITVSKNDILPNN